ncbi:MAG TPA: hypothetical protein VLB12_15705 [Gemmatimonadales bacterium]|nr:hypothetical protein [Gemmatimonadales bacterium]
MDPSVSLNPGRKPLSDLPAPTPPATTVPGSVRPVPSGEDDLFRDPFAEFAPSSR